MLADLRLIFRQLRRTPGFVLVIVGSLALGLGANATVLCWLRHLLLNPVPGAVRPAELAVVVSNQGGGNISLPDARDFQRLDRAFAGLAASQTTPASLAIGRTAEWSYGQIATANFFELLGVRPLLGRTFRPDEDLHPDGDPVVVLGEALWRRRFAADPNVIGRGVELNRRTFTVIGVVPAGFRGTMNGLACEFWVPVSMAAVATGQTSLGLDRRNAHPLHNVARLAPGVSLAAAQAALTALDAELARQFPDSNRGVVHRVLDYADCPYGAQAVLGPVVKLLLAVSAGVLLIVVANAANLMLARATSRQKEMAVRTAIGAGRGRLLRLVLTESVLLSLAGGAAGVLVASWAVGALEAFLPAVALPVRLEFPLDGLVLAAVLALSLATGAVLGLITALPGRRAPLFDTLKQGGRSAAADAANPWARQALVAAEIALALALTIGAGLCLTGLRRARQTDLGCRPDGVLLAGLQVGMHGYDQRTGREFYDRLQRTIAALPGVEHAALANWLPLGFAGCKGLGVDVAGHARAPGEDPTHEYAIVSPGYFATLGTPLLAGRDFADTDDRATDARAAIVNEAFARKFWPGLDPLGRTFRAAGRERTVVGVAQTGRYHRPDEAPQPFFFLPYRQYVPDLDLGLCLRTRGDPLAVVADVRRAIRELDPAVDVRAVMPMRAHVQGGFLASEIAASLLTLLGGLGVLLAAFGVYAVTAYAVGRRTQEFGVRIALGATTGALLRLVLGQGARTAALGVAGGLLLGAAVARLLGGFLCGANPFDPATFLGGAVVLGAVTLLATLRPALRAARTDPVVALRAE